MCWTYHCHQEQGGATSNHYELIICNMSTDEIKRINGFFTIEVQKPTRKIAWFFGLIIGVGLSYIGVGGVVNIIQGQAGSLSGFEIFFGLFALVIGFLLVIRGLIVIFKKSGIYFKGLRTTESGFETGSITVERGAIEPRSKWEKSYAGKIQTMRWHPENPLTGDPLNILVLLKESRDTSNCFFFERFIIASDKKALFELRGSKGRNEVFRNDLVVINNGEFQVLGERNEVDYHTLFPSLKCIPEVLSTSGKKTTCTLNILAKTVDMGQFGLAAGAIGALVGSGIDASRRKSLTQRLQDGRKFDKEFTDELISFADKAGWVIAVEGKEVQLN